MTVESPRPADNKEFILPEFGGLVADRVADNVWVYGEKGQGERYFSLAGGKLKGTQLAVERGISPKKTIFNRTPVGWSLRVETKSGKRPSLSVLSYRSGEEGVINEIFVLDKKRGEVASLARPITGKSASVFDSNPEEVVFIPVYQKSKERKGGVLVLAAKDLLVAQNVARINGFLRLLR